MTKRTSSSAITESTASTRCQSAVTPADPRPAAVTMLVGNIVCSVGFLLGFFRLSDGGDEAIEPVALLSVGGLGILSFVRHAVLHRSDAARMKWDLGGRTDYFQIEVGMANLAWGVVAVIAVLGDWGTTTLAAITAVFGLYLLFAASIHVRLLLGGPPDQRRSPTQVVPIVVVSIVMLFFAIAGLASADATPF